MIASLLIANRGEIARRIIRTARRLGIRTVAAHSAVDSLLPFVREADEALCIGPAPAAASYLDQASILAAARSSGVEAIHPGYGFLAENAAFAEAVTAAGLAWVGAPPAAIRAMGRKDRAKALMAAAGVPVVPGYDGDDQSLQRLRAAADSLGYPVLVKAIAGGGGKGMRRVDRADDFPVALDSCRRESAAAFGDDRVLVEKLIRRPRHIEVQLFGDRHGNMVHLFERDCSLQRRHQKVIEEAPAPGMDEATRAALCDSALRAGRAVDYVGAGTVEFIADAGNGLRADRIWFMEMNTRLQVEHPVTEAITGEDLVEWQLRVASGERLPRTQEQLAISGWAMEARLYAENPATGFLPSTGTLRHLRWPGAARVDSGVEQGDEVTSFYDPLLAKLIVHSASRGEAAQGLAAACGEVEIWPVRTNAAFLARTAADADFLAGRIDTGFIAEHADRLIPGSEPPAAVVRAAAESLLPLAGDDPWTALTGWRVNQPADRRVAVEVAGQLHVALVTGAPVAARIRSVDGDRVLFVGGAAWLVGEPGADHAVAGQAAADGAVLAPMPGRIVAVAVASGERVAVGQRLVVLEAMKMEQALVAPFAGTVAEIAAEAGAQVGEGALLVRIAPDAQ